MDYSKVTFAVSSRTSPFSVSNESVFDYGWVWSGVEQIDSFAAHRSRSNPRKRLQSCGQKAFFVVGQVYV
ncbi:hypothetical protein ALQ08_01514 [Pseudomonas syringae pv. delphinii]|uniref:Uncharacterized protein n=1 Tax=Pseudomonas syringae pv. delphinii TaxID=192088 RepID=A0A3M4KKT0_9PSED|nr:hypothetical protein ALQ08_01514 [Pseudomonas syringae pv. delphinii]